jgi:ribosomal peptide maturation radical SAM protein 1
MNIALINMPFARLSMPSIALTQLAAVVNERFGPKVKTSIHYLNLDFAEYISDLSLYDHTHSATAFITGIGEWFFRQSAFPEAEDNRDAYYARYYHTQDDAMRETWHRLEQKREGLDAFLDLLIDRHHLLDADLVGFTALFSQTTASIAMARRIKARNPDVVTVLGGPPCDAEMGMELAEHIPELDAVFSGPSLESFPRFIGHIHERNRRACDTINGVFTQTNRDRWPREGGAQKLGILGDPSDINAIVPLDYDSFLEDLDSAFPDGSRRPALLFETSRGCWWAQKNACTFCGLNGLHMQHQSMTPENAIAHIQSMYRYAPHCHIFMGVDTALPKGYTRDVLPNITPPAGMTLFYELRPDVTEAEVQILVDAGVRAFQPGIESLSTSSLKLMHKGISAFQNIVFLKNCSSHPLRIDWNLLVFSPGEDEETYEKALRDIPNLMHLAPPSGAYPVGFVRFSRYFENPTAYNLDLRPKDFYALTYPFDEKSVENLAYHFTDGNADTEHINAWLDRLNAAVEQWTQRWLGSDEQPPAQLCFASDDTSWAVYDTRTGDPLETEITETEKRILDALNRPHTLERLQDEFGDDIENTVAVFRSHGWLFEENGRYLSLVT